MIDTINLKGITPGIEAMPCVTLIIPYAATMKNKTHLRNLLRSKADETEKELLNDYPRETVLLLINKLRKTITSVRCAVQGKSIGIFVSPLAEKVYYFTPSNLEDYKLPVLIKSTD
jgi:hypothetical protein